MPALTFEHPETLDRRHLAAIEASIRESVGHRSMAGIISNPAYAIRWRRTDDVVVVIDSRAVDPLDAMEARGAMAAYRQAKMRG